MSDINKTQRELKHSGETPDLRGVLGEQDPEDVDVFGFEVIYTTGEFTVPREQLLAKIDDVGLPEWMAPGQVQPHRAFGRMTNELEADGQEERQYKGERIKYDMEPGETQYEQHVMAKVWHDTDNANANAGKWVPHELGVIKYSSDYNDWKSYLRFIDRIDKGSPLADLWYDAIKVAARKRFERHREMHNGSDVNNMTYYLCRNWTDSVKLRNSCYFVPGSYEDIEQYIDGFRQLYDWINSNHKQAGQTTELFAIEIVDSERQRDMVERKVRDEIETEVDTVFDEILSEVQDGAAADEIAEEVVDDVFEIESLAERHSATLETELSVKRAMDTVLEEMEAEKETLVSKVLDNAGVSVGDA